jgi:Predicted membrane protein (DUF2127)
MKISDTKLLRLIAIFKLLKAALLIAVGVGALRLVHTDVTTLLEKWVARFGLDPGSRSRNIPASNCGKSFGARG